MLRSSSSETPRRKDDDDDDDDVDDESIRRRSLLQRAKNETDEGESSTQFSSVLKVGAAVAGGLLAPSALSLASSSSHSDEFESHGGEMKGTQFLLSRKEQSERNYSSDT
ncbi:hypothetical protein J5N97_025822 [Dioscorea zingiberensis]|uniref:Uncharacterized protein n=1 Tax=Dioscorea zingiberensis TaxID=325984 RepID=A0A9D5H602_9LILI|nr:hypothetical protein J5N97_025822 [Dioscorea zingiberensis]